MATFDNAPLLERLHQDLEQSHSQNDRQFVTALGRGLLILAAFEHHDELSHQALCQLTELPKATVTRLIYTLTTLGFLRQSLTGAYQLGANAVRLSAQALSRHDMVAFAEPLLRRFAAAHEVSVNLAKQIDGEMRYLACCRSPARLSISLQVGSAVPIASTAIGRAFFAVSSLPQQADMLATLQNQLDTNAFDAAKLSLMSAAQEYKSRGYTLSDGEFSPDILAVAVGVFDEATGQFAYSLNASVPRAKWVAADYQDWIVPKLQALAQRIGGSLK